MTRVPGIRMGIHKDQGNLCQRGKGPVRVVQTHLARLLNACFAAEIAGYNGARVAQHVFQGNTALPGVKEGRLCCYMP